MLELIASWEAPAPSEKTDLQPSLECDCYSPTSSSPSLDSPVTSILMFGQIYNSYSSYADFIPNGSQICEPSSSIPTPTSPEFVPYHPSNQLHLFEQPITVNQQHYGSAPQQHLHSSHPASYQYQDQRTHSQPQSHAQLQHPQPHHTPTHLYHTHQQLEAPHPFATEVLEHYYTLSTPPTVPEHPGPTSSPNTFELQSYFMEALEGCSNIHLPDPKLFFHLVVRDKHRISQKQFTQMMHICESNFSKFISPKSSFSRQRETKTRNVKALELFHSLDLCNLISKFLELRETGFLKICWNRSQPTFEWNAIL